MIKGFVRALLLTVSIFSMQTAQAEELVFGRISDSPKDSYRELKPLLDYVVPRMKSVGVTSGRILMAQDMSQMLGFLRRGEVDWVSETTAMGTLLQVRGNAMPILLTERSGVATYKTLIFVRKDSPITDLSQMKGRSIAFQRPSSTTSFFLPASMLIEQKYRLQNMQSPFTKVDSHEVGYIFAQSERNISTWVHKRIVDAGTFSTIGWENPNQMPPQFRKDFRVIATSAEVPRALELVSPQLSPKIRERLKEVLLNAHQDPAAAKALQRYYRTRVFKPVSPEEMRKLRAMGGRMHNVREALE